MSALAASPWSGLGARPGSAPPPAADEPDDFARDSVHRVIPAAGAPSVLPANPVISPFTSWRSGGSAGTATADTAAQEQKTMSHQPTSATAPGPRNTQQRLCELLLAAPSVSRELLARQLPDLDAKQLTQALFNASANGRCQRIDDKDGAQCWTLTGSGRRWITAKLAGDAVPEAKATTSAPPKNKAARRARKAPAPAQRAKPGQKVRQRRAESAALAVPATSLAVREFAPVVERSFRCAVFSDGAFHLAKNGQAIDLTAAEHAEMLRYIERMAVEAA